MTGPWPFVGIGLLLVGLVLFLLRRQKFSVNDQSSESSSIEDLQASFPVEPFPKELAARVFGSEDWEFVAQLGSARLKHLFIKQRTKLALSLLREVCRNATRLFALHSRAARSDSHLEPLVELRVIADYLFIQILCRVLTILIWLRGPLDLFRLVGYADDRSRHLYGLTKKMFPAGLTAERTGRG